MGTPPLMPIQGVFPMDNGQGPFFNGLLPTSNYGLGLGSLFTGTTLQPSLQGTTLQPSLQGTTLQPSLQGTTTLQLSLQGTTTLQPFLQAEYDTFYHYTDYNSVLKIWSCQQILQSQDIYTDAVMGFGVYLTKLGPLYPMGVVAMNNYGDNLGLLGSKIQQGKTNACLEMILPKDKVQDCSYSVGRNIYLHPGNINLSEVQGLKVHVKTGDTTYITVYQ